MSAAEIKIRSAGAGASAPVASKRPFANRPRNMWIDPPAPMMPAQPAIFAQLNVARSRCASMAACSTNQFSTVPRVMYPHHFIAAPPGAVPGWALVVVIQLHPSATKAGLTPRFPPRRFSASTTRPPLRSAGAARQGRASAPPRLRSIAPRIAAGADTIASWLSSLRLDCDPLRHVSPQVPTR
jgi:hypothetical protein